MENKILMVSNAEHEQARIDYISSDLIQHAHLCTDPTEIAALKQQANRCGLYQVEQEIQEVWERYQREFIAMCQVNSFSWSWPFNLI